MSASPVTPAAIDLEELTKLNEDELWARLPQDNRQNLTLYIAALNGCERSLEAMRSKVLDRWIRSFKLPEA